MQYLVSVLNDTAGLATPEEQAAIDVFNDRLQAEGEDVERPALAAAQAGRHRESLPRRSPDSYGPACHRAA